MEKLFLISVVCLSSSAFAINLRNSPPHGTSHNSKIGLPPPVTSTPTPSPPPPHRFQNSTSTLCNVKIFRKLRLPWMDAYGACKALGNGSELVSIRSEDDYILLTSSLRDFDSPLPVIFWTSGVDLVEEGVFSWMSDGTQVDMTQFWAAGQPDNLWDSEHCVGLRRKIFDKEYKMADENCHLAGAFICAQRCSS